MATGGFEGAIFDVDGVLVDSPHEQAWRDALRELMDGEWADIRERSAWSEDAFTPQVYQRVLSGKPRMAGALAALHHFRIPDAEARVDVYAARKQALIVRLVEARQFTAYPDALRFVLAVRDLGIPEAAASSSKNADLFLKHIRLDTFTEKEGLTYDFVHPGLTLLDLFDADLSGRDLARGKPDPEIFLAAAAELKVAPEHCFVVEDAVSGIQAARAGRMAALGVARAGDRHLLAAAHADLVVTSLDEVDVRALTAHRLATRQARS
ncbi:HAD family hydrolase [Nonomuraea muscovyensis]|uniref:Beta-phosphoglucomutase-like phosphatase (HAD superfamily) n=1 Tax=Nonomuraea muscovyensis TaxID=1124761 RepID=A0A7X0C0V5_9ACTN|nr:HAD-IA family hydrolase [Nonomuraea muscovyensis]MBB6346133.1 beta-phosphoglucomutase-like phosphatase (HAD superfamily) [Nonomuraea muscovyensis]MDF2710213.1 HAD-superfamily hydrolase, subfamily variant 3 [Nonomuraea muscovyensis]